MHANLKYANRHVLFKLPILKLFLQEKKKKNLGGFPERWPMAGREVSDFFPLRPTGVGNLHNVNRVLGGAPRPGRQELPSVLPEVVGRGRWRL